MSNTKDQIAKLTQQIKDADIKLDQVSRFDNLAPVASDLDDIETHSVSPCGNVAIFMTGAGNIVDVVIKEDALDKMDAHRMGSVLAATINSTRAIVRESIAAAARSQSKGK